MKLCTFSPRFALKGSPNHSTESKNKRFFGKSIRCVLLYVIWRPGAFLLSIVHNSGTFLTNGCDNLSPRKTITMPPRFRAAILRSFAFKNMRTIILRVIWTTQSLLSDSEPCLWIWSSPRLPPFFGWLCGFCSSSTSRWSGKKCFGSGLFPEIGLVFATSDSGISLRIIHSIKPAKMC